MNIRLYLVTLTFADVILSQNTPLF